MPLLTLDNEGTRTVARNNLPGDFLMFTFKENDDPIILDVGMDAKRLERIQRELTRLKKAHNPKENP